MKALTTAQRVYVSKNWTLSASKSRFLDFLRLYYYNKVYLCIVKTDLYGSTITNTFHSNDQALYNPSLPQLAAQ